MDLVEGFAAGARALAGFAADRAVLTDPDARLELDPAGLAARAVFGAVAAGADDPPAEVGCLVAAAFLEPAARVAGADVTTARSAERRAGAAPRPAAPLLEAIAASRASRSAGARRRPRIGHRCV